MIILKTIPCLFGILLCTGIYANQLDAVAHNATLIDSQCILTVREPDVPLPTQVIIQGKPHKVLTTEEHPFFTHTLLFLETPITTTEPIPRSRTNPTPHQKGERNKKLYSLWLENGFNGADESAQSKHKTAQMVGELDFSIRKEGCCCFIKYGKDSFSPLEGAEPITYPVINDAEFCRAFSIRNTYPGAGYFIQARTGEYQLVGMKAALKAQEGLWLTDVAHNESTNAYIDSAIIRNAL